MVLAALALAPAASGISGQQRVLMLQVTWGPEPWLAEQGRDSLNAAAAYIRSASFGRTWIDGTATEWLHVLSGPPGSCDIRAVETAANAAARAAGLDLGSTRRWATRSRTSAAHGPARISGPGSG